MALCPNCMNELANRGQCRRCGWAGAAGMTEEDSLDVIASGIGDIVGGIVERACKRAKEDFPSMPEVKFAFLVYFHRANKSSALCVSNDKARDIVAQILRDAADEVEGTWPKR